jgi:hypothetical protein
VKRQSFCFIRRDLVAFSAGGYRESNLIPEFRVKHPSRACVPSCIVLFSSVLLASCGPDLPPGTPPGAVGAITVTSSYAPLEEGFAWAKDQALAYVFEGDPVGKWYEAALPGREAFCMRDVSHQVYGGLALGLWEHTENMLFKFAENISGDRQWTSYWEIDKQDRPAPVDYRSDDDFWYNLPANFDVVDASHRAWEWTGDPDYAGDSTFLAFYQRSLTDYIAAWDIDGDGLQESPEENGYRGIATYWEGDGPRALTGADLVAAQYAANLAFAGILDRAPGASPAAEGAARGASAGAVFREEAERLRRLFNDGWWSEEAGRFYTSEVEGGAFDTTAIPLLHIMPHYYGIVEPGARREALLDALPQGRLVEVNVYLAESYYRAGRFEEGFEALMAQVDPDLQRREYPENPFTVVGTTVRYLAGIQPLASEGMVETLPALPDRMETLTLEHVPVLSNQIRVDHDGRRGTILRNERGPRLRWRAAFAGSHENLVLNGRLVPAIVRTNERGEPETYITVDVPRGRAIGVGVDTGDAR